MYTGRKISSLFVIAASVALLAATGCETLLHPTPTQSVGQQIAVQYATGKFIEGASGIESKQARARQVRAVAENLKSVAASESATVAALHELAMATVAKANLAPADRLLATTLVDVAIQELTARVSTGALDPDARVVVAKLLDWVIAAASAYG